MSATPMVDGTPQPSLLPGSTPQALAGLKVIEFGGFAAGPVVGKHLANHGADVIKVESRARLDGFRTHYPPYKDNIPGIERSGIFNYFNDGKRSITLNLKTSEGVEIARRLVAAADVVVENFTPGTMGRLGLGYEALSQLNPGLVMLSSCNQGQFGPHANHPGFGSQLTSLSGFTHFLGFPDRAPVLLYGPYIDYIASGYGTIAVLAALRRRRLSGRGTYVDLAQYETGMQFLAPALLDYFVNGRVGERLGDRDLLVAPHGVFPCAGDDRWVAISVHDDEEWQRFTSVLGVLDLAEDARFATCEGRKAHEDEIEQHIAAWTRRRAREEVAQTLQAARVHAYIVNSMEDLFSDPQLLHRGQWRVAQHPVLGTVRLAAPFWNLSATPSTLQRAAPLLGEHTTEILRDLLHYSDEQIQRLQSTDALQ